MRKEKAIKNATASMVKNGVTIIIGFLTQSIFIKLLGSEYLGVNSLFTNIISMLNIAELGFGTAVIYNLYKPLAEKEYEKIKSLLYFYKKIYIAVSIIISIMGLLVLPFLNFIVGNVTLNDNIYIIYILFLITSISSYLFSYKRSLLYADQKNYIIDYIHIAYYIIINILQMAILYFTKNFYLYLTIKLLFTIIENITITYFVNKKYDYINEKKIKKLDKTIIEDIKLKVKALFMHKIGSFVVLGTDNILISKFFGVVSVGLYSNYNLIVSSVNRLFGQMIQALIPSIGNLVVTEDSEQNFIIFKRIRFINFWIAIFTSCAISILIETFITIWIGKEFILNEIILIIIVFNYFQDIMKNTYVSFFTANGIYHENRFVPIVESIINIISSIILLRIFGLAGVFMGTIVSSLSLWIYSFPKYLYKNVFNKCYKEYFLSIFYYLVVFIIIFVISYMLGKYVVFANIYLSILVKTIYCIIIPNLMFIIIFCKNENFKYAIGLLTTKVNKILKKEI